MWQCIPQMSLKENDEDLQNAKRHMGVSMIAAGNYQSLEQMAYQLHGFVLDMSTKLHGGDLSKITCSEHDGMCLFHLTHHSFKKGNYNIKYL